MTKKKQRNVLIIDNRPQEKVLAPFYASCLIITGCIVYFAYLIAYHPLIFNPQTYHQFANVENLESVKRVMLGVVTVIAFLLFFIIYWANYVANKILGPYQRILKELDLVLSGKRKKPLAVRKGDELFEELLKRINLLVKNLPWDFKYPRRSNENLN